MLKITVSTHNESIKRYLPKICLLILLMVNALFLNFNAFRTFFFLDYSRLIDAAWRIACGQKPYQDFISFCSPLHFWIQAIFFHLFGFGKMAFLAFLIVTSSAIILLIYKVARRLSLPAILMACALSMTSFYWPISHPWYNQTSHLFGLSAAAFFILKNPFKKQLLHSSFIGFLVLLSFMTKFNIGACYFLTFGLVFLLTKNRLITFLGFFFGAVLGFLFVWFLLIPNLKEFIEQSYLYSSSQSIRVKVILKELFFFASKNYYWFPTLIVLGICPLLYKKYKEYLALFAGLVFTGIFATATSSVRWDTDVEPLSMVIVLTFLLLKFSALEASANRFYISFIKWANVALLATAFALTVYFGWQGFTLQGWAFPDQIKTFAGMKINPEGNYRMVNQPLYGWRCDKEKGEAFDALAQYIHQVIPLNKTLLILTDLQALYAVTQRESYRGIPYNFTIPSVPREGLQKNKVTLHILTHRPDYILVHEGQVSNDIQALVDYLNLRQFITKNYIALKKFGQYWILQKK